MLTEVDAALKAGAKTLKDLVPADGEAAPLALENLLGLEGRQQGVADEELGDLSRLGRHGAAGACLVSGQPDRLAPGP